MSKELISKELVNLVIMHQNYSYATKRKVGAIIYQNNLHTDNLEYLGGGFNHNMNWNTLSCEFENITYNTVCHAEVHAIMNVVQALTHSVNHDLSETRIMLTTYTPCIECAKLIVLFGIKVLIFIDKNEKDFETYLQTYLKSEEYENQEVMPHSITVKQFFEKNHVYLFQHDLSVTDNLTRNLIPQNNESEQYLNKVLVTHLI